MNMVQLGHTRDTLPQLWRLIGRVQEMMDEHRATGGLSVSQRGAWYSNRQWELDQGKSGHAGTRSFDNKGKPTQSFKGKQAQQASDKGKTKGKAGAAEAEAIEPPAEWDAEEEQFVSQSQDDRIPIGKGKGWLERARNVTKGWTDWTKQLDQFFDRDFAAAIGYPDVWSYREARRTGQLFTPQRPFGKVAPRFHGHR